MPIPFIAWIVLGAIGGVVVANFLEEIKAWATRILGYILDGIVTAIEVASSAITYLIKVGGRIFKMIEVYIRNTRTGKTKRHYEQEEVYEDDIPEDIKNELNKKQKIEVLRQST